MRQNGNPAGSGLNGTLAALVTPNGLTGHAPMGNGRLARFTGPPAFRTHLDRRADGGGDPLIDSAVRIVAQARQQGVRISQAELARQLRAEGYRIANDRIRWLAAVSGLEPWWEPQ
jgi:hypothetical protein